MSQNCKTNDRQPALLDPATFEQAVSEEFMKNDLQTCVESVVTIGCRALGFPVTAYTDAALGFGGGFGLRGHVCGAISGAAIMFSLAIARHEPDRAQRVMKTWPLLLRFQHEVEARFGSVQCRDVCGMDLSKPQAVEELIVTGKKRDKCDPFVRYVARRVAEELLVIDGGE